ncbi:aspartyl-tRNA(Asn) glutamyl-tRNA (Gln) amidotransferase subunit A [Paramyrothecium foliicola]|nr:aspartyl-tRNA(Asn) glutamyl-tRNA (Gln) amidotransferase subunit A [Paramyrothecium foliicola]
MKAAIVGRPYACLASRACKLAGSRLSTSPPRHLLQQCRRQSTCNHFVGSFHQVSSSGAQFALAVKDNIATADYPTQCASHILSSHSSPFEATIVRQLRERGAVVCGKTNMDEFGMGSHSTHSVHGPVKNPLAGGEDRSAGGSSGGSAVAISLGDAYLALGTDTGGSIRLPAAYTGVVGYKPSYGMLSRFGVVPYANSLDTVGLLAREVRPIREIIFDTGLAKEHDPSDPTSLTVASRRRCSKSTTAEIGDLSQITIGIPSEYNIAELDPTIRAKWAEAALALESRGARVVPVSLPSTVEALCAYYVLAPAEASSNLAKYDGVRYGSRSDESDAIGETLYSETRGAGFGSEVKRRIVLGTYSLSSEAIDNYFIQAQKVRRLVQQDFDRVFKLENPLYEPRQFDLSDMTEGTGLDDKHGPAQVDFLLSPTAPTFPPKLDDVKQQRSVDAYMNDVFTVPASLAGLPAVSIPAEVKDSSFPAGLQMIGQYWDDERLLQMAEQLKKIMSS